jgi:chromosome segregation ATPase
MSERATKAEAKTEQWEKQSQQISQELSSARNQVQAQQIALDSAARELESVKQQIRDTRLEAKSASDEAAELKGRLSAFVGGEAKPKATPRRKPVSEKQVD